jgi:hypothetical protein
MELVEEDEEDVPVMQADDDDKEDERRRPKKKRRDDNMNEEDQEDERPRRKKKRRDDEDDEEDERPRRKKKRSVRRRGAYADCPNCDNDGHATRVAWTWWGGLVGPAIISHVRCRECGTCYNGNSGKSNNLAIGIYMGVGLLLGVMMGMCGLIAAIANH